MVCLHSRDWREKNVQIWLDAVNIVGNDRVGLTADLERRHYLVSSRDTSTETVSLNFHQICCTLFLMDEQYYRRARPKHVVRERLKTIWKNKPLRLTLLVAVPFLFFITFSNKGVIQRLRLESEKRVMQQKIQQARQEQIQLQRQSKALDADPKTIEKVAREKYGMVRDGETVYKAKKEN